MKTNRFLTKVVLSIACFYAGINLIFSSRLYSCSGLFTFVAGIGYLILMFTHWKNK
jgi:hypothetical protein